MQGHDPKTKNLKWSRIIVNEFNLLKCAYLNFVE